MVFGEWKAMWRWRLVLKPDITEFSREIPTYPPPQSLQRAEMLTVVWPY
jgi:hypothetical protein